MKLRRGHLNYRIKNAGLPWTNEAEAGDCIVTVIPMFPPEFSQEQEAMIDRLVVSNSGTAVSGWPSHLDKPLASTFCPAWLIEGSGCAGHH